MSPVVADLLQKRLIFVTGKGGVGKTTVSAALGLAASRLGLRSLLIELGETAEIPGLFGQPQSPSSDSSEVPVELAEGLFHHLLVPEVALREYLEVQLRVRSLVRMALQNSGVRRLMEAAPGWRDLIRLGKLWYLETRKEGDKPRWDLLIVDAPATGHGLTLFSIPDAVVDTVRVGPLRRHALAVQALMHDSTRTLVLPVTLPEELPIRETIELMESLEARDLATAPPIVNSILPAPCDSDLPAVLEELGQQLDLPDPMALRELLQFSLDRAKREQQNIGKLRDRVGISLELPRLDPAPQTLEAISELASLLDIAADPES